MTGLDDRFHVAGEIPAKCPDIIVCKRRVA